MFAFIVEHIVEIIFGLISAGALAFCKHMNKQMKDYKRLLEEEKDEVQNTEIEEVIKKHLTPITTEIKELEDKINKLVTTEKHDVDLIVASWRFRLIQLCRQCIDQGYITRIQYDQLTEFYKIYHELGGNGQAQDYYETATSLPIRHE